MSLARSILLAGSQSPWLHRQALKRRFVRRAVSRFMPGETLDDAVNAAVALAGQRMSSILTHLGENISDRAEADAESQHYLQVLERIRAAGLNAEASIKLTQLGLDLDPELAFEHTRRLAERANAAGSRLWIDMEGSPYTQVTLDVYRRLREAGADVGVAIQAYLHRTRADIDALIPLGPAFRLVKGAYREPARLALQRKSEVDESFFALAERLMSDEARRAGAWVTVATHDPVLIRRIEALANARGLVQKDFEFAMLYGIQRAEQQRLARAGYRVRILISYGTHWFPWYMRRLAEKPANVMLVARSMFGA
jgi:proline dehydrogenase